MLSTNSLTIDWDNNMDINMVPVHGILGKYPVSRPHQIIREGLSWVIVRWYKSETIFKNNVILSASSNTRAYMIDHFSIAYRAISWFYYWFLDPVLSPFKFMALKLYSSLYYDNYNVEPLLNIVVYTADLCNFFRNASDVWKTDSNALR